jgi:hypothetical protein
VLSFGLTQPKEQPRLLQQLPHFYLLPFPRKKLGDLRTWMHHVENGTERTEKTQKDPAWNSADSQCFFGSFRAVF